MMNTEVGSGGSFLAFAPLLWDRRGRGPYLFPPSFLRSDLQSDTQSAEFNQESVSGLSQPRRVSTFDSERVEDVRGCKGEKIRDKGVAGGADASRLEQKASARH